MREIQKFKVVTRPDAALSGYYFGIMGLHLSWNVHVLHVIVVFYKIYSPVSHVLDT